MTSSQGIDVSRSTISQLEQVSQKHEINVVAELGIDRLVQWVGVYVLTALAIIIKLTDIIAGSGLSCYPGTSNSSVQVNLYLIKYASAYCWDASVISNSNGSCSELNFDTLDFLQDPYPLKVLLFALPYFLLAQSLFFAVMWALWHFRFGARLQGHLRFMKLLLEDIYDQLKHITEGFYAAMPYDRTSIYFDGLQIHESIEDIEMREFVRKGKIEVQKYEREKARRKAKQASNQPKKVDERGSKPEEIALLVQNRESSPTVKVEAAESTESSLNKVSSQTDPTCSKQSDKAGNSQTEHKETASLLQNEASADKGSDAEDDTRAKSSTKGPADASNPEVNQQCGNSNGKSNSQNQRSSSTASNKDAEKQNEDEEITRFEKFLVGEFRDQHFFSMLCSENFSSLHHLPYILSVYKLKRSLEHASSEDTPKPCFVDDGILKMWCHSKNLRQVRLVKWYFLKHLVTGLVALGSVVLMLTLFAVYLRNGFNSSETFRCELPLEDVCMLCTVNRKAEIYVVLFIDIAVTLLIALLSIGTVFVVRSSKDRVTSCFFKQIDISNVALAASWRDRLEADKKK